MIVEITSPEDLQLFVKYCDLIKRNYITPNWEFVNEYPYVIHLEYGDIYPYGTFSCTRSCDECHGCESINIPTSNINILYREEKLKRILNE